MVAGPRAPTDWPLVRRGPTRRGGMWPDRPVEPSLLVPLVGGLLAVSCALRAHARDVLRRVVRDQVPLLLFGLGCAALGRDPAKPLVPSLLPVLRLGHT